MARQVKLEIISYRVVAFIMIAIWPTIVTGQYKAEREYRIKEKEVPKLALSFVDGLDLTKKVCWYKEEGLHRISVEAKTKIHGTRYSIEFDTLGQIEDIEYEVKFKELADPVRNEIEVYFDDNHEKTKVKKVQVQLTGQDLNLQQAVKTETVLSVIVKYEIVVKAKIDGSYVLKEYLFDANGILEQSAEIIYKNSDNLEF